MITARDTSSENDVLYRFAMNYQHPDAEQLDEYVRRHPAHADALTNLAIELALEQAIEKQEQVVEVAYQPDEETDAMLSRAMSRFQNLLYEVKTKQEAMTAELHPKRSAETTRDLFTHRSPAQMRAVREKLDVSPLFLKRLRDREIRVDTIPQAFIHLFAQAVEALENEVAMYLSARPQIAGHVRFKSEVAPTVGRQVTFEEAVRSSGLTNEQQTRLLALKTPE